MLKTSFTVFFLLLACSLMVFAQNREVLKPIGSTFISKSGHSPEAIVVHNKKGAPVEQNQVLPQPVQINNVLGTIDTLSYRKTIPGEWNTNFGCFGQDMMVQWFEAPADLIVKAIGGTFADNNNGTLGSWRIYRVGNGITLDSLQSLGPNAIQQGRFAASDPNYVLGYVGFEDESDGSGYITSAGLSSYPYAVDEWSDIGFGWTFTPVVSPVAAPVYQYIETINLFFEPTFNQGDIFALVFKNESTNTDQGSGDDRIGFWSETTGQPPDFYGWKFYVNGRSFAGDVSTAYWYSREYTWDMAPIVDLIGDRAPVISSFTIISSGPGSGPFTINATIADDNPSGGAAGVASAILQWNNDGGTIWNDVTMTGAEPNYSGVIPVQSPNTSVFYRIVATDVAAGVTTSSTVTFFAFGWSGASTLVVFNGLSADGNYPQTYYWGPDNRSNPFDHDVWAYGSLSPAVVNNYTNILEMTTSGPVVSNIDTIRAWLEADGTRNYMLAGDEWLGQHSNWTDTLHIAGEFHFDILGINFEYNDIVNSSNDTSVVYPQAGTLLGGPIFDVWTQVSADNGWTSEMLYDPVFEITVVNWLDGVTFEGDVEVDMMGLAADGTTQYPILGHRTLTAGNKIAFFAYDPLSLNSGPDYWWYGYENTSPQVEVLKWFGIATGVEKDNNLIPEKFSISQNYPNPFNPSTTIKFSVPQQSNVVLKVYDILGSEVANLVNETLDAGNYTTIFDASQFASGMYIYTLTSGSFTTSKKMMLLK